MEHYGQLNMSGDDMNLIQVGRPAVSRYHNNRRFYMTDQGVNYDIHDFPSAELSLKLGGFMALSGVENIGVYEDENEGESDVADVEPEIKDEPGVDLTQGTPLVSSTS